ncbi:DUF169 domain-containing protein [Cytobacillus sp. NCCP-133]|uniref:DUF169 domain-containing protein n=1 Tax=Cytobacillus sp. NCCP-133 TaxID=766848 RepID=UPI00222F77FA|nr:DUF169 domain-containing protein [Cytobacillus sp. NCCP-133]GLB59526.1 hypothetical protein NCCP133_16590 [Cytobacillus sp. NCCP-133]
MEQTRPAQKLSDLETAIHSYVRPDTFPLAIRVMKKEEVLPEWVKRPAKDFGKTFSICQGVTMARRYGWALAMGGEDLSCPIAKIAFGFEEELDYYTKGSLTDGMYTKTCNLGELTEAAVPKFTKDEAGTVLIAPLGRASFEPEVITVYANSAQVMRMVAGALYHTGGEITSSFTARADCADIVIKTIKTNKPQVILPCYGDRVFGQTHDHEMAFTIPFAMADAFIEGLQQTHKGGVRYPVPTYLQYEAKYPDTYEKLNDMFDSNL